MRRLATALGVTLGVGALVLAPAAAANAHDYLVSSTPKAGSTVSTELTSVKLTFDDRVLDLSGDGSSNVVQVTGPAGKHFETGCPTIADTDVTVPVALGASGDYTARWQIVSADGHTVTSSLAFSYDKPASVTAAEGADRRPTCGDQAPAASSGSAAATDGDGTAPEATSQGSNGLPLALGVGGGVILVALVAVVVVLTRARRGSGSQPPSAD
ncbi:MULTISPECIES: copper resistance CopC family protein [unclassified Frondihabitans]|uniref:copper resistance CopC family protein n=1 Tax=unclassified Frondihabitans TaxID=2626248 RepID=UPI000F4E3589|nr:MULTISPECIES: copper resistance CopC family protein [unclassified Frondihabitans]RPE78222.1 hypothetical protein EDF37_0893 [Frondihabitans sp. PhB153]RPF08503.1 hypothetical protein EDF39_0895 [Frondihabitans sp. PhB161]